MTETQALEVLMDLIRKPDVDAEKIPAIWAQILEVHALAFAPPPPVVEKKRRRRRPHSENIGWPQGLSRSDYTLWKQTMTDLGFTENLNPREAKRQIDTGGFDPKAPKPMPKSVTTKAVKRARA